jgi:hypothetical protein
MHTNDARAMGETEQRIRALSGLARSAVLQRPGARRARMDRSGGGRVPVRLRLPRSRSDRYKDRRNASSRSRSASLRRWYP